MSKKTFTLQDLKIGDEIEVQIGSEAVSGKICEFSHKDGWDIALFDEPAQDGKRSSRWCYLDQVTAVG